MNPHIAKFAAQKSCNINARITPQQHSDLQKLAVDAGITLTEWARNQLLLALAPPKAKSAQTGPAQPITDVPTPSEASPAAHRSAQPDTAQPGADPDFQTIDGKLHCRPGVVVVFRGSDHNGDTFAEIQHSGRLYLQSGTTGEVLSFPTARGLLSEIDWLRDAYNSLLDEYKAELQSNAAVLEDDNARSRALDMQAAMSYVMQLQTSDTRTSSNTAPTQAVNK